MLELVSYQQYKVLGYAECYIHSVNNSRLCSMAIHVYQSSGEGLVTTVSFLAQVNAESVSKLLNIIE